MFIVTELDDMFYSILLWVLQHCFHTLGLRTLGFDFKWHALAIHTYQEIVPEAKSRHGKNGGALAPFLLTIAALRHLDEARGVVASVSGFSDVLVDGLLGGVWGAGQNPKVTVA